MPTRPASTRLRRSTAALLAGAIMALGSAGPALAQDSLPDPNQPGDTSKPGATKTAQQNSPDLPTTGIETTWLVLAGVALLTAGVAVRPAARLRRHYRTDTWEHVVRSRS